MIGSVDDRNRALIDVEVRRAPNSEGVRVTAWIDTAFDGHLVLSKPLIEELKLESFVETEATLATGTKVVLETFLYYLDWFGRLMPLQVIANDGKLPLLGTALSENRVLHIDYAGKHLTLD